MGHQHGSFGFGIHLVYSASMSSGVGSLKHARLALLPRDVTMAASAQRPKVGHMIEIVAFAVSIARQGPDVVEFSVKRIK